MCSLAGEVMLEESANTNSKLERCKKCLTEKPSVILRKTDAYCKCCFIPSTIHKFRAAIAKNRIIRPNEKVLIVYQNGHASTALLHFIRTGLDLNTHKKLRIEPIVIFIDDYNKLTTEKRLEICQKLTNEITTYKFPAYYTSLHKFLENINSPPTYTDLTNLNLANDKIENYFQNSTLKTTNVTQFNDVTEITRRQLIIGIAKELKCRVVFTTEISVDVAINMLSNVSLGRGAHLSLDVGAIDDRDPEIKILQPLRYFDMKELAYYNIFNNIEPLIFDIPTKSMSTSVNKLISTFVHGLQENYPSTIKTVVRTGDKLTYDKNGKICDICKAPVENQMKLSSSEARDFSHWVSTNQLSERTEYIEHKQDNLCYGCKNISSVLHVK